ncbi:hypothetical protein [Tepidibacter thalassicus]|uniref:Uncharacterized protein n=1 Tax=Tepidibacter thalassicus DSM 15285 TaxID=1123350 RepID=A0A1M5SX40_9FIRM|nr:hypothetical protein [Tepidibacter thalassicus]SHH43097.1 hypothetical protein SAMN02744040_01949 [Tepidibacter thalassicus DSM 15285]
MRKCITLLLLISVAHIIIKFLTETREDQIRNKIKEMGGKVISIDRNNSYIKEVNKIMKKKRFIIHSVYKVVYILNNKERIAYVVVYRDFVIVPGKLYKCDWVEDSN